jgi:cytochrome P450
MRPYGRRMRTTDHVVTSHGDLRAVLGSPDFAVPPVPQGGRPGGIDWLRASVARFSNGATHQRRRSLAVTALARVAPADLRRRAAERTAVFADPDRFDTAREGSDRHVAFAAGPRSCPGQAHALASERRSAQPPGDVQAASPPKGPAPGTPGAGER